MTTLSLFPFFFFLPNLSPLLTHPFLLPHLLLLFLPFLPTENEFRGELVNQRWTRGERTSSRCQASQRLQSRRPIMVSDNTAPLYIPTRFITRHHTPFQSDSASWAFPSNPQLSRGKSKRVEADGAEDNKAGCVYVCVCVCLRVQGILDSHAGQKKHESNSTSNLLLGPAHLLPRPHSA